MKKKINLRCFCCNKPIKGEVFRADCSDDQKNVTVGPDCYRHIMEQANWAKFSKIENPGYMPKSGGPSLFPVGTKF